MIFFIIGLIIGILILAFGAYYLVKNRTTQTPVKFTASPLLSVLSSPSLCSSNCLYNRQKKIADSP